MNEETKNTATEHARTETEKAVNQGENISNDVRDITVDALTKHHLDLEHIRSVIKAVLDGAQDAVEHNTKNMKDVLKEVTNGLDEALEKSAYASKLAIEETAGRIKDFTEHDLKKTMDDLSGLEEMLIDSLSEAAKNSKSVATETFEYLSEHLKNSGTAVGHRTTKEIIYLTDKLEKIGKENIASVSNATKSFTEDVARAASGFLAGIADSIEESKKEKKPTEEKD